MPSQVTRLDSQRVPVVVAGLFLPGVALLRRFSAIDIPVYGVDDDPQVIGFLSRYGVKKMCPNPENEPKAWVAFMVDLAKRTGQRPVLISTADKFVLPISDYAGTLEQYFRFPNPGGSLLRELTSKRGSFRLALEAGFPIPNTCFAENRDDVEAFTAQATFPCLIKPEYATSWRQGVATRILKQGTKVVDVATPEELLRVYEELARIDPRVVIQEVVEGPDENLVYVVCYIGRNGKVFAGFAGQKTRVDPIHFGSASYVELVDEPQLQTDCEAFLQKIGYRGFAGVEVKRDRRDGKFRLIEINPRFGLWDDLGAYIGADVGMSGYRDLIGEEVAPSRPRVMDYRWASFHRDLRAFFAYRREGLLTLSQWLRSLHGPIVWADPRWDEPRISIVLLGQLARGIGRRLLRAAHGDS